MLKIIIRSLFCLTTVNCLTIGSTSFGDYSGSIYNSIGNQYFWPDNLNILPISKDKSQLISFGWRLSDIQNDNNFKDKFNDFDDNLYLNSNYIFKWVPEMNKNIINALISTSIDSEKNTIYINKILGNPYINFDIKYLITDLEQLSISENYYKYKINYQNLYNKYTGYNFY